MDYFIWKEIKEIITTYNVFTLIGPRFEKRKAIIGTTGEM